MDFTYDELCGIEWALIKRLEAAGSFTEHGHDGPSEDDKSVMTFTRALHDKVHELRRQLERDGSATIHLV